MSALKVEDRGDGWKVYGVWYGVERAVYTGKGPDDLNRVHDCLSYVRADEMSAC